jgi:hypothetical protein
MDIHQRISKIKTFGVTILQQERFSVFIAANADRPQFKKCKRYLIVVEKCGKFD